MSNLIISLAQIRIAPGDVEANIKQFEQLTVEAARRGSDLIVFPELWSTGYVLDRAAELADPLGEGVFARIAGIATQNRIAVLGSVLEKTASGVTNCAAFINGDGEIIGTYRKIHLFRLMDEDQWLEAGNMPLTLDLEWGKAGIAICYDLRFPELFRCYAAHEGAKIILLPAEWPLARIEHWRTLVIARAIENQCYVVASNAADEINGTVFGGHSMIVDPWGKIVVEAGESPLLITAEIDLSLVEQIRNKIPVFEDRRADIYGN